MCVVCFTVGDALWGEGLRWESRPQGPFWLSQPQCPPVLGREEGVGRGGH